MLKFKSYLAEEKNTHMTHLEDAIIENGTIGARQAISYLRSLRDMLVGNSKSKVNVTVKWDGAPAIFAGKDPSDGKFFVAKKGVFNKNPKVYKSDADIDEDVGDKPDLANKMKLALKHLPSLGIEGVVQGDFLYSKDDLQTTNIDGEPHITFHPNTIVYAIPKGSELATQILASDFGVVWHTTYRGDSFESMSATFGKEIAGNLKSSKAVWSVDAMYKDVSGTATFTKKEAEAVTKKIDAALKLFNKIDRKTINTVKDDKDLKMRMNAFINLKVREGQRIGNTKKFVDDMVKYIDDYWQKEIDKMKSEKGKETKTAKRDEVMAYFKNKRQIVMMFDLYDLIIDAKLMVVRKLDSAKQIGTFLKTNDGYKVTEQEGFVAIDRFGKNAVKLIDRLQFSAANFSPDIIKGWQK